MLNIYGTNDSGLPTGWTTKITSLLKVGEYGVYDQSNYSQAGSDSEWIIALEDGKDRLSTQSKYLSGTTIHQLFKGCNNLDGVTVGSGLVLGCCSLVRPGTVIGDQVYVGAGSIIDINCNIGDSVTIGDNVTVHEGVTIPANTSIPSGSVVHSE
jgi:NDP-sugar pyrophosphorylase family protein